MNSTTPFRTLRSISLCLLVATGLLVAGCDSGGSNGGGGSKSGAVTAKVEGGEATGTLGADFSYQVDGETCTKFAYDEDFSTPGDKEFDPTVIPAYGGCSVENAKEWDAVEVTFNPNNSADGLTLKLTSGGSEIASTSSTNTSGNLSVTVEPGSDS